MARSQTHGGKSTPAEGKTDGGVSPYRAEPQCLKIKLAVAMVASALLMAQYWFIKRLVMDIIFPIYWLKIR